jgi:hypothetical protein
MIILVSGLWIIASENDYNGIPALPVEFTEKGNTMKK